MPGLKKLISNIKSRGGQQDRENEFGLPKLARTDAQLQKNSHQGQDDLDMLDRDVPGVPPSRKFSFESGQSVGDFEAELSASASRPRNSYTANLQPRSAQRNALVSKHGLTINTAAANSQSRSRLPQAGNQVFSSDGGLSSGVDGTLSSSARLLRGKPATISSEQRYSASSSTQPSSSQYSSTENVSYVRNSQAEPTTPITPQSSFGEQELPEAGTSKAQGKQRLVAIGDIDWSQIDEDEGAQIARAYGSSKLSRQNPSDNSAAEHNPLRLVGQSGMENRWLNRQDFSNEYEDFLAVEENERKIQELNDLLKRLIAEDAAKEAERERLAAEEVARLLAEEEAARLLAEEEAARLIAEEEAAAEAARIAEELARLRECAVCGDAKDPLEYAAKAPTAGCQHEPQTCKECMESWMASEFETKGCDGIKCPECTETLEYNDVQECASAETFDKYDKLATRNALGGLEEFAWCLKPECGSGQMNIDNNCFMDCVSCGYKQCLKHKVPWHKGETCDQYEYRVSGQQQRDEEKKTEEMLDLVSKKCPNKACGWRIQKISGCEHMTCKKCKHEFCWLCLAAHADIKKEGNTAHAKNCKFHSANLEVSWPFNAH